MTIKQDLARIYRIEIVHFAVTWALKAVAVVIALKLLTPLLGWLLGGWTSLPLDLLFALIESVQGFSGAIDGFAAAAGELLSTPSFDVLLAAIESLFGAALAGVVLMLTVTLACVLFYAIGWLSTHVAAAWKKAMGR